MKRFATLLALLLCIAAPHAAAQQQPEIDLQYIEDMKAELEALRGLEYTRPVEVQFVTQDEIAGVARDILVREGMGPEYIAGAARVMQAFGFLENADMLQEAVNSVLSQQIEGLYDTEENTLFVVQENILPKAAQEMLRAFGNINPKDFALSHELEHALQAQHFDLTLLTPLRKSSEDLALAYKCVVEGDAMAVMMNYSLRDAGANVLNIPAMGAQMQAMMDDPGAASALGDFPDVPEVIKAQFLYPYNGGLDFLGELYRDGGWDAVNRAFTDPPLSSEQVIHPEKYMGERDNPVDLDLEAMASYAPAGAPVLDNNVLGEFHVRLLLKITGSFPDEEQWAEPAAGWDGDRYIAFGAPDGRTILYWASEWDNAEQAREFFTAYSAVLTHRFGNPAPGNPGTWNTPCGPAVLAIKDTRVALAQCPDPDALQPATNALLSAPAQPFDTSFLRQYNQNGFKASASY